MLLALISVILMIVLFDPQKDASRVYYGTDTRAFSLLFGALLAILWEYRMVPRRLSASVNMVLGSVSFAVLLVMTIAINGSSNFWYRGGQFFGTILTVLMVYAVSGRKTCLSRFLSNPVLKWIGDRSYSIYLWHYPIILLISKGLKASWWITLIEIVLSVVLAELSYRFIETWYYWGIFEYFKKQTEIQAGEEAPGTGGKKKFKGNSRHICTDRVTDTLHDICAEEKCIGYITKT